MIILNNWFFKFIKSVHKVISNVKIEIDKVKYYVHYAL